MFLLIQIHSRAKTVVDYISDPRNGASINPACFYSGHTNGTTAQSTLGSFKGTPRNCHSIDDIIRKAGVQKDSLSLQDWSVISKALAQHVSGKVYVLLGMYIRPDSGWLVDEKPILKANRNVNTMEMWKIEADGKVVNTGMTKENM